MQGGLSERTLTLTFTPTPTLTPTLTPTPTPPPTPTPTPNQAGFQNELVAELYRENEFEQMLCEAPEAVRRRTECHEGVRALERAMELLGELRDVRL